MSDTLVAGTTQDTGSQAPAADATAAPAAADTAAIQQSAPAAQTADPGATPAGEPAKHAGAPEKYEFKAPEGTTYDAALLGEFEALAREQNMTQEAAQKIVEKMAPKVVEQYAAQQLAAFTKQNEGWIEATKTDKEFGGDKLQESLSVAKKALDATATPELRKLLNETGLGNHPEVIRHFFKVGKSMSQDSFVPSGAASGGSRDAARSLYPSQQ